MSVRGITAVGLFGFGIIALFAARYVPPRLINYQGGFPYADESPKLYTQIALTFVLVVASLYVILSKRYQASERGWAYATIGAATGYWLKA